MSPIADEVRFSPKSCSCTIQCDAHLAMPELVEALELADLLLSGANMDRRVVEKKVRAALAKAGTP